MRVSSFQLLTSMLMRYAGAESTASVSTLPNFSERSLNVPPCAVAGQQYIDPSLREANVGLEIKDSSECQARCVSDANCSVFTYYLSTGGCWLHSSDSIDRRPVAGAISGPRTCPEVTVTRAVAKTAASGRFIKVRSSGNLFFESFQPRTKHLVRFRCTGCPLACDDYTQVDDEYAAQLPWTEDFECEMLNGPSEATKPASWYHTEANTEVPRASIWAWLLALLFLGICSCGLYYCWLLYQQRMLRREKPRKSSRTAVRPGLTEEKPLISRPMLPVLASHQGFDLVTVTPNGLKVTALPDGGASVMSSVTSSGKREFMA